MPEDVRPDDSIEDRAKVLENATALSRRESQVYACLEADLSVEDICDRYDWGVSDYSPAPAHIRQYANQIRSKADSRAIVVDDVDTDVVRGVLE